VQTELKLTIFTYKWGKCVKSVGKDPLESLVILVKLDLISPSWTAFKGDSAFIPGIDLVVLL
jgi:hypothetical protein